MVYLFLGLICLSYVFAGSTYKLDLSKEDTLLFGLEEKDRVEFELNNGVHTIILDKVKEDKIEATMKDGILRIVLPKKKSSASKKIEIKKK